jgi:hypothetical protein
MSRSSDSEQLIIGGEPRVDLLPPEVKLRRKARALRRTLSLSVFVVLVLVVAGYGTASWRAWISQAALVDAHSRTAELLSEQTKYAEVRRVQDEVDNAVAARQVGASTEIDWKAYLEGIRGVLPGDVTIDTVSVDAASPLAPHALPTAPLQGPRVATLMLSLTSPGLPTVPDWLTAMKSLAGYADGAPASITRSDAGAYVVSLVLHINESAFANRFTSTEGN